MKLIGSIAVLSGALLFAQTPVNKPVSDPALVGLWGAHSVFGPVLQGELLVRQGSRAWRVQIGGREFSVNPIEAGRFHWRLPGGLGELRGRQVGGQLEGFWIQPSSENPAYATPLLLAPAGAGIWHGRVEPLPESLSLYLDITGSAEGGLRGSFHNPERRWNGGAPWFQVVPDGDHLRLVDPVTGRTRFTQPYDAAEHRITMEFGTRVDLVPVDPLHAPGFLPRTGTPGYTYRVPASLGDGWKTGDAREEGLDVGRIETLIKQVLARTPAQGEGPRPHAILLARNGKLVLDEYFFGFQASDPHDLRSASKSLTSLLVGAALDRRPDLDVNTPLLELFGIQEREVPGKARITLAHALTHTTGLASDDNDDASPGSEDRMQRCGTDWQAFMLGLPLLHEPGSHYAYSSGGINLALGAVQKMTGRWVPEFFDEVYARPMGIRRYHMNLMPDGDAYGGGGMYMTPRDLLKFGQLLLQDGKWEGHQLVSASWLAASTSRQATGPGGATDGFGWHLHRLPSKGGGVDIIEANGNGGQFLIVVPAQQMCLVITAGNYNQYGIWRTFREEWLPRYLLMP